MMSDLIFVLSDQNGDLIGHMYFQEKILFTALEEYLYLPLLNWMLAFLLYQVKCYFYR